MPPLQIKNAAKPRFTTYDRQAQLPATFRRLVFGVGATFPIVRRDSDQSAHRMRKIHGYLRSQLSAEYMQITKNVNSLGKGEITRCPISEPRGHRLTAHPRTNAMEHHSAKAVCSHCAVLTVFQTESSPLCRLAAIACRKALSNANSKPRPRRRTRPVVRILFIIPCPRY